ncbi:MAG: macro domain-containing protein [Micavibrio sp.]
MFKRIAQKLSLNKHGERNIAKIKVEFGGLLAQDDCESILFFMRPNLQWGGGINKAVLDEAGAALDEYVLEHVIRPKSGSVHTLPPFQTKYKAMFMAVLADWDGGNGFEERDLLNCYRLAIAKAQDMGIKSMAIPAMGRDKRDFPHIRFARVALKGIFDRLDDRIDMIKIMCADRTMITTYHSQIEKFR